MDIKLSLGKVNQSMNSPQTFLSRLFRDCILFFLFPIDFLLTFSDPLEKISQLKEVNVNAHNLGQKLLKEMKSQMSGGMQIYFFGSNFFKIVGINDDIDFLVEYATEDEKEKWKKILVTYFGNPILDGNKFTKWESMYNGFRFEVLLSHPKFRIFRIIFDGYDALCADPELLAEYEKLKRDSIGLTLREYNRRQLYFFRYFVKNKMMPTRFLKVV